MTLLAKMSAVEEPENRLAARKAQPHDLTATGTVITSIQQIDAVLSVTADVAPRPVDGEVGVILIGQDAGLRNPITRQWAEQVLSAVIRLLTNELRFQFKEWVDLLMRRPVEESRENFTIPLVKVC